MKDQRDASAALQQAWPHIVAETRGVLGSELHYQAMVYHCLRAHGGVPSRQIGMNVKMWIADPASELFRKLGQRKHEDFRGGFEPIPDICLFANGIASDWRRRNHLNTMGSLLLAIELKASERAGSRLSSREIIRDIEKLSAHNQECVHRGAGFLPVMMVIDTAPEQAERMTALALEQSRRVAEEAKVEFLYVSADRQLCALTNLN